jgi:hypothetical protein
MILESQYRPRIHSAPAQISVGFGWSIQLHRESGICRHLPRWTRRPGEYSTFLGMPGHVAINWWSVAGSSALHLQATWISEKLQLSPTHQLHLMAYKLHVCVMEHFRLISITISACFASRLCQLYVLGIFVLVLSHEPHSKRLFPHFFTSLLVWSAGKLVENLTSRRTAIN